MPKFPIPATIDEAPAASRPLLRTAEARFGRVPNMALLLSVSPAALRGYLALLTALDGGTLGAQTCRAHRARGRRGERMPVRPVAAHLPRPQPHRAR